MARAIRRTKRRAAPSLSSAAPTTTVSPIFSTKSSVLSESPLTSDDDRDTHKEAVKDTVSTRRSRALSRSNNRKRSATIDELSGTAQANDSQVAPVKRRALKMKAFVEIQTRISSSAHKGGNVLVAPAQSCQHATSFDNVSEDAFENDLNAPTIESECVDSEVEFPDESRLSAMSSDHEAFQVEEDEEALLSLAIDMSLRSARLEAASNGRVGQSSQSASLVNSTTSVRAASAKHHRQKRGYASSEDEDFVEDVPGSEDSESDASVSSRSSSSAPTVLHRRRGNRQRTALRRRRTGELVRRPGYKLTPAERTTIALQSQHPELVNVWDDIGSLPTVEPHQGEQPADLRVALLPFQRESLYWMREQEKGAWSGGMLADEMGMGKTIQILSLMVTDGIKSNLVVAPTVAVMQWKHEIINRTSGMSVVVWHGSSRQNNIDELKKYDIVLTTYAVLESCFRRQQIGFKRGGEIIKESSPLHAINWNRIVLDEAHNIKERSTNTAKACFELNSKYKWCLSGTPLQNRVGELYSLVRFLGGDPFSYYFCKRCDCKSLHWKFTNKRNCDGCGHSPMQHTCFWNNEILTPIQKNGMLGPGRSAFKKLKILLDRVMLRRTKIQKADDLGLPPRTVIIRRDYFSPEEKELYQSLFSDAKRQFNTYLDQGTILNNYSNIFSLLTRMRQMACHPDLVIRSKSNAGVFVEEEGEATVCRLCNDLAEDAIMSKCRHIFDRQCIKQYTDSAVEHIPACPVCHVPLTIDLDAPALELEENVRPARQGILGRVDLECWRSSSKIEALVEELSNLRLQDATTKSLVFSQFVNFLDLIAFRLQKAGFKICRLEGTMSPQARDLTIQHFMNNVDVTVFLVSLKAGGVALNLTEASRVYLMDSWWNPAVEYQAMDRIHRLGQYRPVKAIKLVIEDSIESRIVQLQEKKLAMVDATLSADESAMGRLTPEDLGFLFKL